MRGPACTYFNVDSFCSFYKHNIHSIDAYKFLSYIVYAYT